MQLLLTLGHHSSAILVDGKRVLCGYEEERLSKVKSDSSYPKLAIEKIIEFFPKSCEQVSEICISHWFDFDGHQLEESKYFQPKHLDKRFPNALITTLDENFTHHDAHANALWNFSETRNGLTIVADGFGNDGETITIYRNSKQIFKNRGISLGLMYQYATAFLGMKENQDEYKLLGYETHIQKDTANRLHNIIDEYYIMLEDMILLKPQDAEKFTFRQVCSANKKLFNTMFNRIQKDVMPGESIEIMIAYTVQQLLERIMVRIIEYFYDYDNDKVLQFTGGVFYNVKLNNKILNFYAKEVDLIEFMPLCGDEGCALGFTNVEIDNVFWGLRKDAPISNHCTALNELLFFNFGGAMEFGPRALGATSCIAEPTIEMADLINEMNGRPSIMPMAPMISSELADKYCKNISVLGKCKHFMICATDWIGPIDENRGVLHKKPLEQVYTCRPQVVDNEITAQYGIVINTSLNAHGQPIIYDYYDYLKMVRIHEKNTNISEDSENSHYAVERVH